MKILLTLFVLFFSSSVVAKEYSIGVDITGSAWIFNYDNGNKKVIFFEKDATFTYLKLIAIEGNEGKVYSESDDTWTQTGANVVLSYNDGYKLVSLTIKENQDEMSGTSVNKVGLVQTIFGNKIE